MVSWWIRQSSVTHEWNFSQSSLLIRELFIHLSSHINILLITYFLPITHVLSNVLKPGMHFFRIDVFFDYFLFRLKSGFYPVTDEKHYYSHTPNSKRSQEYV